MTSVGNARRDDQLAGVVGIVEAPVGHGQIAQIGQRNRASGTPTAAHPGRGRRVDLADRAVEAGSLRGNRLRGDLFRWRGGARGAGLYRRWCCRTPEVGCRRGTDRARAGRRCRAGRACGHRGTWCQQELSWWPREPMTSRGLVSPGSRAWNTLPARGRRPATRRSTLRDAGCAGRSITGPGWHGPAPGWSRLHVYRDAATSASGRRCRSAMATTLSTRRRYFSSPPGPPR